MIIYTGGTIGMINQPGSNSLTPFDFEQILRHVPEIEKFGFNGKEVSFVGDTYHDFANINQIIDTCKKVNIYSLLKTYTNKFTFLQFFLLKH